MKKVFIVTGELSGDKLGAWYIKKCEENDIEFHAVGGDFLETAGAIIYDRFEKLNVVGLLEILSKLFFILSFLKKLTSYIIENNFDEVVVVDFPGFNLRLIKALKKKNPSIKITYFSPPQLWVWGSKRVNIIKKYCDDVIVIYPFEVEWFKKHGVLAHWRGYPFYENFKPYFKQRMLQESIAIIPGSRLIEIKQLLPIFAQVVKKIRLVHPHVKVVLPLAESIDKKLVKDILSKSDAEKWGDDIEVIQGESEKYQALSTCCVALTKPGTITLELALLGVPSVVAYRASSLTYLIAKVLVSIEYMALPNLLLNKVVFPEYIQGDCKAELLYKKLITLYSQGIRKEKAYQDIVDDLDTLKKMLQ